MGVHVHTCIVFPALATDTREAIKCPHRGVSLEMGMLRLRAHDAVAEQVADCWYAEAQSEGARGVRVAEVMVTVLHEIVDWSKSRYCASHLSHPGCIKNADRSAGTGDGTIFAVRRA